MIVQVTVIAPESGRGTFSLRLPFTVGRGPEAKFRIRHERVSRRHCELYELDGRVFLRDLDSTNGTLVGGADVDPAVPVGLSPGAVIRVGHVTMRVDYDAFADAPTAAFDADEAERIGLPTASDDTTVATTDVELERFLRRLESP